MLTTSTFKKYFGLLQIITVITLCVSLNACQKDSNEFIPTGTRTETIVAKPGDTAFLDESKLGPIDTTKPLSVEKCQNAIPNIAPFTDTLTAEKGKTITFPDGTIVEIPANVCTNNPDGNKKDACKGQLRVFILVLKTRGELITYNLPTVSEGALLQSGGVVFLQVTQNGKPVFLQTGSYVKVRYKMPVVYTDMKYFEGDNDINTRLNFDWKLIDDNRGGGSNMDSVRLKAVDYTTYQLLITRFTWVNCDRFYADNTPLSKKLAVALPDSFSNQNTSVFIAFTDALSVVRLVGDPSKRAFVIPGSYKGLPTGKPGIVVTISLLTVKNTDRYYFSATPVTIGDNTVKPQPVLITLDGIRQKLLAL